MQLTMAIGALFRVTFILITIIVISEAIVGEDLERQGKIPSSNKSSIFLQDESAEKIFGRLAERLSEVKGIDEKLEKLITDVNRKRFNNQDTTKIKSKGRDKIFEVLEALYQLYLKTNNLIVDCEKQCAGCKKKPPCQSFSCPILPRRTASNPNACAKLPKCNRGCDLQIIKPGQCKPATTKQLLTTEKPILRVIPLLNSPEQVSFERWKQWRLENLSVGNSYGSSKEVPKPEDIPVIRGEEVLRTKMNFDEDILDKIDDVVDQIPSDSSSTDDADSLMRYIQEYVKSDDERVPRTLKAVIGHLFLNNKRIVKCKCKCDVKMHLWPRDRCDYTCPNYLGCDTGHCYCDKPMGGIMLL